MFRFLLVLSIVTSLLLLTEAQEESPSYALAFHAGDNLQIALFRETGGWQLENLGNSMLFGQYDVSLALPQWTESGQLVGTGYDPSQHFDTEPMYTEPAVYLYRYDARSQTMETMAEPIGELESDFPVILGISSISPNARYLSLYDLVEMKGYLVDFEAQETLFTLDTCGLKAFRWSESTVFLGSYSAYITCPPSFFEYSLASRSITSDWSESLAGEDITVFEDGVWLNDSEFLMSAYGLESYFNLVYLRPDEASIIAPLAYSPIAVSDDKHWTAFSSEGEVKLLKLETMEIFDVAEAETNPPPFFIGEDLQFVSLIDGGYGHGRFLPEGEEQISLYFTGNTQNYLFSPDLNLLAITTESGLQVYGESGLLWDSTLSLNDNSLSWSEDNWLRIEQENGTLSVNPTTGEIIDAPEQYGRFISASPDGKWWLYIIRQPDDEGRMYQSERLLLYAPQTDERFVLVDGENVYDNFHFPLKSYFIWSPRLD